MEKFVQDLKSIITFKDTTVVGDIVLIAAKEPQMLVYALVTDIERDNDRKDEWWHVHLAVLSIPIQDMSWTLRTAQMTGMEIFTMGGEERFVKAIAFKDSARLPSAVEVKKKSRVKQLKRVK